MDFVNHGEEIIQICIRTITSMMARGAANGGDSKRRAGDGGEADAFVPEVAYFLHRLRHRGAPGAGSISSLDLVF